MGTLGRVVEVVEDPDVTPRGAAMLAGLGIGLFGDYRDAVARFAPGTTTIEPQPAATARYEEIYRSAYVPLQDALEGVNHRLAGLTEYGGSR